MHKANLDTLKQIAERLPNLNTTAVKVYRSVKGSVLLDNGVTNTSEGTLVKEDKNYVTQVDEVMPTNHFKKLKRIYKAQGSKGVDEYINQVNNQYLKLKQAQL